MPTRPAWSMRCSTNWRGKSVPGNFRGRRADDMAKRAAGHLSGEDRLIARYFAPLARHAGSFGLQDDAAILSPPAGHDVVLKADAIVGGMHFFPNDPADAVARKALRVNLSDLAAK